MAHQGFFMFERHGDRLCLVRFFHYCTGLIQKGLIMNRAH